jgi:phenylpropionate dioxygenase-like ring-hydroxylating dioxygenase large terminal subunit
MGTPSFDADEQGRTIPEEYREKLRTHHVKDFDKKKMGLHPVRTDTALGLVFANVGGEAPLLKTWLGDILHTLEPYIPAMEGGGVVPTVHQTNYQTECNWKVLVENFVEYYHLPAVHPALCDVSGVDEHRSEQGTGMYGCFVTDPLTKGSTAIDPGRLPPWRGIEGTPNALQAYHTFIYPNVFFSVYPDHFFRVIVRPDGPTRSFESATLFTSPEALDNTAMLEEIHAFWDNVNTEDISICNAVQLGTAANVYDGGRFSFRFEEPVHRFQNMMAQMMIGGEGRYRMPQGSKDEIN